MKIKKIISLVSVVLMAISFNGCGENGNSSSNVGSSGGKDSPNRVIFESIDADTFMITLERNSYNYLFVSYTITDSDGNSIHYSGINPIGKAILTCTNSYSDLDGNMYQCIEKYTFDNWDLGKMDDVESKIIFYKNRTYTINMIEGNIGQADKVTHIKTLQGEY